jgi:hypothetical protein
MVRDKKIAAASCDGTAAGMETEGQDGKKVLRKTKTQGKHRGHAMGLPLAEKARVRFLKCRGSGGTNTEDGMQNDVNSNTSKQASKVCKVWVCDQHGWRNCANKVMPAKLYRLAALDGA